MSQKKTETETNRVRLHTEDQPASTQTCRVWIRFEYFAVLQQSEYLMSLAADVVPGLSVLRRHNAKKAEH